MSETTLEKKIPAPLVEKGQYIFTFGVIAVMLYVAGFPFFVIFFLGVLSYFIWKMFSSVARIETRRIFEFYLSANEILRKDERRWYGFEIQEAISKGENIVRSMSAAPPLLYFTLGALYHKVGDHGAAVKNLSYVIEDLTSGESLVVFPTPQLRDYVKLLRKIERDPAEAPLLSAAVRSLERARKNLGKMLLEDSRAKPESAYAPQIEDHEGRSGSFKDMLRNEGSGSGEIINTDLQSDVAAELDSGERFRKAVQTAVTKADKRLVSDPFSDRKSISEVLHDIYDKKV